MADKQINQKRYFWNPETKEKVFTEYTDGTLIKLNEGQLKKTEEAKAACLRQSLKEVESDINMRRKPAHKRLGRPKEEEKKKK